MRIPDAIHQELLNWSRWCWLGPWPHPLPATQCGSLESQYRAPPDWNPDDTPPEPYIRPNERQAKRVQAVYERLDDTGRLVLQAEYPRRHEYGSRNAACHRLGLTVRQYESWLQHAINEVEEEFEVCA